jgi:hypothetical protein
MNLLAIEEEDTATEDGDSVTRSRRSVFSPSSSVFTPASSWIGSIAEDLNSVLEGSMDDYTDGSMTQYDLMSDEASSDTSSVEQGWFGPVKKNRGKTYR